MNMDQGRVIATARWRTYDKVTGSPSRCWYWLRDPPGRYGARTTVWTTLTFSPDGREVVLTDLGPGPAGEEAVQVFTLNIDTGERVQLTHLPFEPDHPVGLDSLDRGTCCPIFLDNGRISFLSYLDIDGSNRHRAALGRRGG